MDGCLEWEWGLIRAQCLSWGGAEVCGRVMLYLARNWALSDTSALNKAGATNVNNKTNFETADEFKANHVSALPVRLGL